MTRLNRHVALKFPLRWSPGWLWLVVLLALPNCGFEVGGLGVPPNLDPGPLPHSDAVFCDIETFGGRHCASPEEIGSGIRLAAAAVAINTGAKNTIGLDESPAALARCGGAPEAVTFEGPFPDGLFACLNCGAVVPATYADSNAVCIAKCQDVIANSGVPGPPDVLAYCSANAHAATNFPISSCFMGACSTGGTLRDDFVDPRRPPEAVTWTDLIGTAASGGDGNALARLTATSPPAGNPPFDAGAASIQWIARGDAYVEFSAAESSLSHVAGLSQIPAGCLFPCADTDAGLTDISFGISLNRDGRYYVLENGSLVPGPDINTSFGIYAAGDRFRVSVKQSADGSNTATITYSRLTGSCIAGMPCPESVFFTHAGPASYPMRVDASFRETAAKLTDVRVVRIR